jgi:hypothetical protein
MKQTDKHAILALVTIAFQLICNVSVAVDFDADIRPLLVKQCVGCHGVEEQNGELRLDTKAFAWKGGYDGPAVVVGHPDRSPLFQRITSTGEDRMPPVDHVADPLTDAQIALVKAWIESGAPWPESDADRAAMVAADLATQLDRRRQHWSVQPIRSDFAADASIDQFIGAKLHENGLDFAPSADWHTLKRRIHFDLIGLPPTVTIDNTDLSDEAYHVMVDHLLASPQHGQRWARHWLDIAHYADTHGFERDQLRPNAWPYRDYVIQSLNDDKPYDQFLREQIAGDIIAPDSPEMISALGFLVAGPWDFVGQVETKSEMLRRAARAGDLDDIVTQVITATMGITIHCARCHDHKLDPISQREYYRLWSVFAGVKRGERDADPAQSKRTAVEKKRLSDALANTRTRIAELAGDGFSLANLIPPDSGIDLRNGQITKEKLGYHSGIAANELKSVPAIAAIKWVFVPDGSSVVMVDTDTPVQGVPPTSRHFWDTLANRPLNAQRSTILGGTDYANPDQTMLAMHANSGITLDLDLLRQASGLDAMRLTGLVGFGAAESAAGSLADFTVYVDTDLKFQRLKIRKDQTVAVDVLVPSSARTLTLIATDGGDGISSDLLYIGNPKLVPDVAQRLSQADIAELQRLRAEAEKIEDQIHALPESGTVYSVLSQSDVPTIKIQRRGDPENEGPAVSPGGFVWPQHAVADFGDDDTPEGLRRLALADWIVHPDNPLTARVIVNRLWHHHFGQGIVTTPSDFGIGGDAPSHPELLDFLARQLIDNQWSLKHIHKLIVTSRTYRQASFGVDDSGVGARIDAGNRLLWRQNARRLDAETLRDTVLVASGNLDLTHGGPGFRDFRYTEAYAPIYEYITPDQPEMYRRSIYRFVVRTTPHPFMTTLDCPDPANLTPVRAQTTTALQALAMINNDFMLRQARYMATRIQQNVQGQPNADIAAITESFVRAFQRSPTSTELDAAGRLVAEQGLFGLCRILLNANEFIYVD